MRTLLVRALAATLVPQARHPTLCARKRPAAGLANEGSSRITVVNVVSGAAVLLTACTGPTASLADTIEAALVRAYQNNPQLNAQRAAVRATDENVPQALSGYRPRVALTGSVGYQ